MENLVDYGETLTFIVLVIASILAVAVGIERAIEYSKNTKKGEILFRTIIDKIRMKNISEVKEAVIGNERNIYARFADFSAEHYKEGQDALHELMIGRMIEERVNLEKRLVVLNTLGNNAPFIGLLGTVLGVIKAFHGLGTLGNTGAEVVMRSISTALLATAAGLFVAIPVVITNNFFSRKLKVIMANLEVLSREFLATYSSKSHGHSQHGNHHSHHS